MPPKKKQKVAPPQERFKALKIVIIDALPFQRKLWQERIGAGFVAVTSADDRALAGRVRDDVGAAPHVVTDEWLTTTLRAAAASRRADSAWRAPPRPRSRRRPRRARAVNVDAGQNDDVVAKLKAARACQQNTRAKIVEIFETGDLGASSSSAGTRTSARKELTTVFGVQTATANQLIQQGVRSVADLRAAVAAAEPRARGGHEDLDLQRAAPSARGSATRSLKGARDLRAALPRADPFELSVEASGSFRRGAACGGVDVLVTAPVWRDGDSDGARRASDDGARRRRTTPATRTSAPRSRGRAAAFLRDLRGAPRLGPADGAPRRRVPRRRRRGRARRGRRRRQGPARGAVDVQRHRRVGGAHRRVGVKCYAPQHYAFALVYFSSGDHFNRAIRSLAKAQGYSLCDTGLRASARSGSCYGGDGKYVSNKIQVCRSVPCATEADIFDFLGIDYKSPEERAVADNATAVGSRARAIRLGAGLAADSDDDDAAA
ncbi:DNA-directed DNA polymerase [Aureococcus anophagefferens]|nr:DNA-directed DNA polymerase [Aureococcus anophagefferens]